MIVSLLVCLAHLMQITLTAGLSVGRHASVRNQHYDGGAESLHLFTYGLHPSGNGHGV